MLDVKHYLSHCFEWDVGPGCIPDNINDIVDGRSQVPIKVFFTLTVNLNGSAVLRVDSQSCCLKMLPVKFDDHKNFEEVLSLEQYYSDRDSPGFVYLPGFASVLKRLAEFGFKNNEYAVTTVTLELLIRVMQIMDKDCGWMLQICHHWQCAARQKTAARVKSVTVVTHT